MKIATIASGTTTLVNKQVETSCQKLLIDCTIASALAVTTMAEVKAAFLIAFPVGANITVTHQGDNGITQMRKMRFIDLLEFSTNNDGLIRIDADGTNVRVRATIELSNSGSFNFDDKRTLVVNIEGKANLSTMDVYAIDFPGAASNALVYSERAMEANTEKVINVAGLAVINLPIDTLDTCEVYYNNGRMVKFTQEEFKQTLMDGGNPIVSANGRIFHGYMNFGCLNVESAWQVKPVLTAASNIFLTENKAV